LADSGVRLQTQTYAGLFMVTMATLMFEILLTRIFSVTMWYHFAFVAISLAMFGMTVGALVVHQFPRSFTPERAHDHLAWSSLGFAITIVVGFMTNLSIPFVVHRSVVSFYSVVLSYSVIAVPFVFSGICVCLALTKFPGHVNKLYAADLAGASAGCILLIYALEISDGPSAVLVVALLASIGSVLFASGGSCRKLQRMGMLAGFVLAAFAAANVFLAAKPVPLFRLMWVKGVVESRPLYEKWNSFSRIRVSGDPNLPRKPWGLSSSCPSEPKARELDLSIDAGADTVLTFFDGKTQPLEYLKCGITNLAHYLREDSSVLVIGPGGGRDVLSALVFDQKSVLAVEMNQDILHAVNRTFGDFTGHLDAHPKVTFVADEARSYIARAKERFDIIQISLIDTWAATAAGAFVLSENSLYTVEAWTLFLTRLNPHGVLTVSRWYFPDRPAEMYRATSLAAASLKQLGVEHPRNHIAIVRHLFERDEGAQGMGTILVARDPFTEGDLAKLDEVAARLRFDVILSPRFSSDSTFAALASGRDLDQFVASYPLNIAAPTDDAPFFFQMLRLGGIFKRELQQEGIQSFNLRAVSVLGTLLIVVGGLTFLCIIIPLLLTADKAALPGALPLFTFFACIGIGFMLVEISQMQRLIIFLGHPTYGLSVVLFSLLLSSGLGSFSIGRVGNPEQGGKAIVPLILLLTVLALFGVLTPPLIRQFRESATVVRILVATGILSTLGFFMGMAFPLGMRSASLRSPSLTPWLWGINGAASVLASVLAIVISLGSGISTAFWTGSLCYALGAVAFVWNYTTRGSSQVG